MASVEFVQLLNETGVNSTQNTAKGSLSPGDQDMALVVVAANQSSANMTVQAQHSPDNGTNWINIGTAITVTANGAQLESLAAPVLPTVRAVITVTGGSADLDVRIHKDPRRR